MIDKLLLGLLVGLLPVGLLVSYLVLGKDVIEQPPDETMINADKLEEVIRQTVAESQPAPKAEPEFVIGSVSYASTSAELVLEATAPTKDAAVLMTAVVLPANPSNAPIQGLSTSTEAVLPSASGAISYRYKLPRAAEGLVEFRLEQAGVVKVVRYNLDTKSLQR